MRRTRSRGKGFAKVVFYIVLLLAVAAAVGFIYKFTNGFNEDFKTFYVEQNGNKILSADSTVTLKTGEAYRFDVKYTFDTVDSEPKDYSVRVLPNVENDFAFTVDGDLMYFSWIEDLNAAFGLEKGDDRFSLIMAEDMRLQSVLERCYPGQQVVLPAEASGIECPYVIEVASYNGGIVYRIAVSVELRPTDVSLNEEHLVFGDLV